VQGQKRSRSTLGLVDLFGWILVALLALAILWVAWGRPLPESWRRRSDGGGGGGGFWTGGGHGGMGGNGSGGGAS
jgi:hypothetical protein